ncbi:MAG: hypothetical protein O7G85_02210 [Planctomycetota bacterium]|nr:hypothetical protein [Planctomycetota bacterium]
MNLTQRIVLVLILLAASSTALGQRRGSLSPGGTAPGLDIEEWGTDPINIEVDNVYFVLFLPDSAAAFTDTLIDFLDQVQIDYQSRYPDFHVIMVNRGEVVASTRFERMLGKLERVHWGSDRRNSTERAWMGASGLNTDFGFFIIDRKSQVQYITGTDNTIPDDLEEILALVLDDRYDVLLMDRAERYVKPCENSRKVRNFRQCHMHLDSIIDLDKKIFAKYMLTKFEVMLLDEKKKDEAYYYADQLISECGDDPNFLMWMTDFILEDPRISDADRDLDVAMNAAEAAFQGFHENEPAGYALLGKVNYHLGNLMKAVEYQEKAWLIARPNSKPEYWRTLIAYKEAARRQGLLSSAR